MRSRSAELSALTSIAAQVNCTQELKEILRGALETTLGVMGEGSGEIFLIDEDSGDLVLSVHQGLSEEFLAVESVVPSGECLCGLALQSPRPMLIDEMMNHPVRSRNACERAGFRSCIRLPLLARGEILGLLNIQSQTPQKFTDVDEEFLTAIGNQIGIAIANAKLIEDAEQRRATLDSVMRSMVDGLILLDRRGGVSYVNPRAELMLGLQADHLVGQTLTGAYSELSGQVSRADEVRAQVESAAAAPEKLPFIEIAMTAPRVQTLQLQFFPIWGEREEPLGLGLLLRDITREKELDEMKSQLLSTVGHELRTPLASIKGFASTLLRKDVEWDETSRHEFLSIIDQESDRLAELISNLLDMSRFEAGTLRVEPEPMDLVNIVQETANEFQMMTHEHQLTVEISDDVPLVLADPRRVRQVLRNLVENAVKYSPDGGAITLKVVCFADEVGVSVTDQGLGIEPEHLVRVFERFFQVDSASTRKVGGTGLGLSISKAIIEEHTGRMWAESQPGTGSTFYFTLPLASSRPHTKSGEARIEEKERHA